MIESLEVFITDSSFYPIGKENYYERNRNNGTFKFLQHAARSGTRWCNGLE